MADTVFLLIVSGLARGGIYALLAFGFVLLLKATDTLSFTQFQFVTLGGYLAYSLSANVGLPFYLVLIVTGLAGFMCGTLLYYLVIKPMAGKPPFSVVVATIGFYIMLKPIMAVIWGYSNYAMPLPFKDTPVPLGFGVNVSAIDVMVLAITLLFILAFIVFFNKTLLGTQMRAVANDTEAAHMMGIGVNKVYVISWGVAALSAFVAGTFLAGMQTASSNLGEIAVNAIPVIILGGSESVPGSIVGGLIIGMVEALVGYYFGLEYATPILMGSLLLVLMLKPSGLFGESQVQRV